MKKLAVGLLVCGLALTGCGGGDSVGGSLGIGGGSSGGLPDSVAIKSYSVSPKDWQVGSKVKLDWEVSPSDVFSYNIQIFENSTPVVGGNTNTLVSMNCGSGMSTINGCAGKGSITCDIGKKEDGSITATCYSNGVQNPSKSTSKLTTSGKGYVIFKVCATNKDFINVCDTKYVEVNFPSGVSSQSLEEEQQQQESQQP